MFCLPLFYCKNTTCYARGNRRFTNKKTNLLRYNEVGLAANNKKRRRFVYERHKKFITYKL